MLVDTLSEIIGDYMIFINFLKWEQKEFQDLMENIEVFFLT